MSGPSALVEAARNLAAVLRAAELRELPMPFSARASDQGHLELQFHTAGEVVTWAEMLVDDAELEESVHVDGARVSDHISTTVTWCDAVEVRLVASVPRRAAS